MRTPAHLTLLLAAVSALVVSGCRFERAAGAHAVGGGGGITLDVAVFEGGYGIEWHRQRARAYERLHPGLRIHLWGDPRVDEKIKPRILRRNPPDLASCTLPVWKLIVARKLYPLDEALDSTAYGQEVTWRRSLMPGLLANFQYEGKTYALPLNFGIWVCWYDRRLFRRHGWEAPETWAEFTTLCAKIKAAGIGPIAFQGKYPTYAWFTLLSLYQRLVPFEQWYAMQDLRPGELLHPQFIRAARLLQDMATRFLQPGAMAMTHTESQLEWVNGRAALVFCGLWLKNEMKDALPPGFEMDCFPVPVVAGGRGDPRAVYGGGGENFFVFADAKHPREAADFLKFMVSLDSARSYITTLDTLSPVRESYRGLPISSALRGAVAIQERSTRNYSDRLTQLYLEFGRTAMPAHLAALIEGKLSPEEFGRRMEASIEAVRRDPEIYKPPAIGVPPLE